jgi:serine/threonine-protein kinase PpkA
MQMTLKRFLHFCLIAALCFGLSAASSTKTLAQSAPMLMDGKDTLFQRILVRNATYRFDEPDGSAGDPVAPLTPLYVYARNGAWVKVGFGDKGDGLFWVPETATTLWNQNIVATFEASENIARLLFFADTNPIYDLLELETPGVRAEEYRREAEAAENDGAVSDTVVALGPRRVVDQRDNLYVMPIIDFEEEVFDSGAFVKLLRVAVARAQPGGRRLPVPPPASGSRLVPDEDGSNTAPDRGGDPGVYRAGVVFVVDTTISMNPYIQATRSALREVYETIDSAGVSDAVSFGLIGYRDALDAAPDLGYATQTFVNLQDGTDSAKFLAGIDDMTEADRSSRNFREDSYAGIQHALTAMDWSGFDGRFIVLVTDAGPREVGDEYSQTGLSGQGINQVVRERIGGAIAVFHLKTERGRNDHASAEAAYRELTRFPNQPPFYYDIENGDPAVFQEQARTLGAFLAQDVKRFQNNPDDTLRNDGRRAIPEGDGGGTSGSDDDGSRFAGLLSAGRTMQLAYLGRTQGEKAPDVFEAYVVDRDFDRTALKPLSIRVLITKSQLSALFDALQIIVQKGEESIVDPGEFFAQVLGAAADMSRSPDRVSRQSDPSLAQAVAIDEYIEDLPYRSRIMTITEDDWLDMSFSEQASIINDLYDKIARYEEYNEATDLWVDYLGTGAQAENLLYPLPLDDLP